MNKNKKKDTSPKVHQNAKIRDDITINNRELTPKQIKLIELLQNKNTKCVFIAGPAGTSKTYTSVLAGLNLLNQNS